MSGVKIASIVGVNFCSSPSVGASSASQRERDGVQEGECLLAHHDDELRLHDVQFAHEKRPRLFLVAVGELQAVRAVHRQRIDAQPLQRLEEGIARTSIERHALLELRRARQVLEQEDVGERMTRADDRYARTGSYLRDFITESVDLGDRLLQVFLVDFVGRHGHLSPNAGSPSADPFLGLRHPLESLEVRKRLRTPQNLGASQ